MSITAPLEQFDVEDFGSEIRVTDDLVLAVENPGALLHAATKSRRDPVIPFLYLGIISLLAIIATSAYLAL